MNTVVWGLLLVAILVLGYIFIAYYVDTSLWLPDWIRPQEKTCYDISCGIYGYKDDLPDCGDDCTSELCCKSAETTCSSVKCITNGKGYKDKNKSCGLLRNCDVDFCCNDTMTCQSMDYQCPTGKTLKSGDNGTDMVCDSSGCNEDTCCKDDEITNCNDFACGNNLTPVNKACGGDNSEECSLDYCCTTKLGKCCGNQDSPDAESSFCSGKLDQNSCENSSHHCLWCENIQEDDICCNTCKTFFNDEGKCSDTEIPVDNWMNTMCKNGNGHAKLCTSSDCCSGKYCKSEAVGTTYKELIQVNECSDIKTTRSDWNEGQPGCTAYVQNNNATSASDVGSKKRCERKENATDKTKEPCEAGHSCNLCPTGYYSTDGKECVNN